MRKKPGHKRNKKELAPLYRYMKYTERQRKELYDTFLEKLTAETQMTEDMVAGMPLISMAGSHSIKVSNYQSILEYSTERIRISTKKCPVIVSGTRLCIQYFRSDEIKIVGNISGISYQS